MAAHLQALVTAQSAHRWDVPALICGDATLTYGQLETKSDQLAHVLRESGSPRGDRVCVLSRLRPEVAIAMLAIYKADCTYVPLDVDASAADLAWIVQACQPQVVLTDRSTSLLLDDVFDRDPRQVPRTVGSLERDPFEARTFHTAFSFRDVETVPTRRLVYRNWASDAAHILFRVAAMGVPKGDVVSHESASKFIGWANHHFGVQAGDRQCTLAALPTETCLYGLLGTLSAGATAYLARQDGSSPSDLATLIRRQRLTALYLDPAQLNAFADADAITDDDFPSLKRVVWSGETAPVEALRYWMGRLPHTMFSNLQGFLPPGTFAAAKVLTHDQASS